MNKIKKLSLNCETCITKPCQIGCPLNNDIPAFIKCIKENNYHKAYIILKETTILPSICGRICPHLKQCEGSCLKGVTHDNVQIGQLEAYIGDLAIKNLWNSYITPRTNYKVAIIGGGPSGLTCASFLNRNGINATIYEKYNYLGGLLVHGIPEFRLPKTIVKQVTDNIIKQGVKVKYNMELGKNITIEQLKKEYDAIYLAIGANVSNKMNIPGEDLTGVYGGNELLEHKIQLDYQNKEVVISGAGNVAMDVSRTIKRLGAKRVTIIYRRSEKEMPADLKEVISAKEDGIEFIYLTNIIKINGDKLVNSIEVVRTKLTESSDGSRIEPIEIEGSNYTIPCDYVIMAIGSHQDKIVDEINLEKNHQGKIQIDSYGRTNDQVIFSGGDVAGTKSTVAWASMAGRNAAEGIIKYLQTIKK